MPMSMLHVLLLLLLVLMQCCDCVDFYFELEHENVDKNGGGDQCWLWSSLGCCGWRRCMLLLVILVGLAFVLVFLFLLCSVGAGGGVGLCAVLQQHSKTITWLAKVCLYLSVVVCLPVLGCPVVERLTVDRDMAVDVS